MLQDSEVVYWHLFYLYLKYISNDVESVLVFQTILRIGAKKEKRNNRVLGAMGTLFQKGNKGNGVCGWKEWYRL